MEAEWETSKEWYQREGTISMHFRSTLCDKGTEVSGNQWYGARRYRIQ